MLLERMCGVHEREVGNTTWSFGLSTGKIKVLSTEMRKAAGRTDSGVR